MRGAIVLAALLLSACATARMHSGAELNSVASQCGLALGQVAQDEEEKRLLFVMQDSPTPAQRLCVARWAKKRQLKLVVIESIQFPEEGE